MTDESLQKIFDDLRNIPTETGINDVSDWIDAKSGQLSGKRGKRLYFSAKKMIMTAVTIMAILGTYYFYSMPGKIENQITKIHKEDKVIVASETSKIPSNTLVERGIMIESTGDDVNSDSIENRMNNPEIIVNSEISVEQNKLNVNYKENIDPNLVKIPIEDEVTSGIWKSINDSLYVDTIFTGVKKLIFNGRIDNYIRIVGSNRDNINMVYSYNYLAKGFFIGKSKCELGFEKVDSVLKINVKRNTSVNVGVVFTRLSSNILFEVPENIAIDLDASYGDIDVKELIVNDLKVKTAYGDIRAKGLRGNALLNTNYGDISMSRIFGNTQSRTSHGDVSAKDVSGNTVLGSNYGDVFLDGIFGNIQSNTSFGDIKAVNITGSDLVLFNSKYGDIDLQINNPISDSKLELKTGYGRLKVKRSDLEMDSKKSFNFGNGRLKITAISGNGDVIIK